MVLDAMPPGVKYRHGQHDQRENRQQMNWTPRPPQPDGVNPEGADAARKHERDPHPADRAMRDRSLRRAELDDAENKGGHCRKSVKSNGAGGLEQRSKSHEPSP